MSEDFSWGEFGGVFVLASAGGCDGEGKKREIYDVHGRGVR